MFSQYLSVLSAMPEPRVFGLDSQTLIAIIANLINVGILAFVLAWLLYRPVRNFLKKRAERIAGQIEQADEATAKANEQKLLYEQKLSEVGRERDEILEEARRKAAEISRQIVAEAKQEADAVKARAAANVEMEWERVQDEMKTAIIQIAAVMAEKIVTLSMDDDTQERLFTEAMAELGDVTWHRN